MERTFPCPHCQVALLWQEDYQSKPIQCGHCGQVFVRLGPGAAAASEGPAEVSATDRPAANDPSPPASVQPRSAGLPSGNETQHKAEQASAAATARPERVAPEFGWKLVSLGLCLLALGVVLLVPTIALKYFLLDLPFGPFGDTPLDKPSEGAVVLMAAYAAGILLLVLGSLCCCAIPGGTGLRRLAGVFAFLLSLHPLDLILDGVLHQLFFGTSSSLGLLHLELQSTTVQAYAMGHIFLLLFLMQVNALLKNHSRAESAGQYLVWVYLAPAVLWLVGKLLLVGGINVARLGIRPIPQDAVIWWMYLFLWICVLIMFPIWFVRLLLGTCGTIRQVPARQPGW